MTKAAKFAFLTNSQILKANVVGTPSVVNANSSLSSITISRSSVYVSNYLLVQAVDGSGTATVSSVSSTVGGVEDGRTWSLVTREIGGSSYTNMEVWAANNATSLSGNLVVTITWNTTAIPGGQLYEIANTSGVVGSGTGTSSTGTTVTPLSIETSPTNLIFDFVNCNNTISSYPSSPWTYSSIEYIPLGSNFSSAAYMYGVTGTEEATSWTQSTSTYWSAISFAMAVI